MNVSSFASRERTVCATRTSTQGMPINVNNLRHSSLCSFVTLTWRRLSLSTSSAVPERVASVGRKVITRRGQKTGLTGLLCLLLVLLRLLTVRKTLLELRKIGRLSVTVLERLGTAYSRRWT